MEGSRVAAHKLALGLRARDGLARGARGTPRLEVLLGHMERFRAELVATLAALRSRPDEDASERN
jgi:hypothetical protein